MTRIKVLQDVKITGNITLSEEEMRAIHALTVYGVDKFINCFYDNLGTSYLKPHEKGLRSFLSTVKEMQAACSDADEARKILGTVNDK